MHCDVKKERIESQYHFSVVFVDLFLFEFSLKNYQHWSFMVRTSEFIMYLCLVWMSTVFLLDFFSLLTYRYILA